MDEAFFVLRYIFCVCLISFIGGYMLFNYLFIFMFGSLFGYVLELFYRKIKFKKWANPGVFYGPYLPLYGFGLCICYFVYLLNVSLILKILLLFVLLSFIEFVCGCIFIKGFNVLLWNYSGELFNYKGLVCLKFSLFWLFIGVLFSEIVFECVNFSAFDCDFIFYFMYVFYTFLIVDFIYRMLHLIYFSDN